MKHYLLFLLASLALLTGCEKDDDPTSVSLRSITREKFDYKGGLASAIVDAGGRDVTAESSESWCRTAVIGSIVNFNVLAYTGSEERSATVTVKAEGLKPLLINVVQDKFRGLVVVPSTLIFSDTDRTLSVAVTCSGVYDVKLTENPNNAFSFSMLFGFISARINWGTILSGDPKEFISLVVWGLYAWLFHQRFTQGWQGRKPAILAIWIFTVCAFSLIVVNLFMTTHHSFLTTPR